MAWRGVTRDLERLGEDSPLFAIGILCMLFRALARRSFRVVLPGISPTSSVIIKQDINENIMNENITPTTIIVVSIVFRALA